MSSTPDPRADADAAPPGEALTSPARAPFVALLTAWLWVIAVLAFAIVSTRSMYWADWKIEALFLRRQDRPMLVAFVALMVAFCLAPASWLALARLRIRLPGRTMVAAIALVCLVVGVVGWRLVFNSYAFSLDEFLANFDAQIFASGRLMAPVPLEWRPYVPAMQPIYMLPLPSNVWVSSYLPVNAAMRALGRLAHVEELVNPLLSAFSVFAVWGVGRRLWPERPSLALIAVALMATSPQFVLMSMTAYAMPAHLAFNLAWLWLFLRGDKLGHAGAIAVGFLATGIHQLIFHPMFVAPFILQLWIQRRWWLAALYTVAYALICLFWIEYWPIAGAISGIAPGAASTGGGYLADRISDILDAQYWRNVGVFAENLVRFAAWQNPLLVPLAVIGTIAGVRAKGDLRPLVAGIVLTLAVVFVATPTQTHGWGYRYMHGLLGSTALLAAWGWARLTDALPAPRKAAAEGALAIACAVSVLVLIPVRTWEAWSFVRPFAAANAAIQSANADIVVIDHVSSRLFDAGTVTRNDPFLRRRPRVMTLFDMSGDLVRQACAQHSVLVFNADSATAWGLDVATWQGNARTAEMRALMQSLGCYKPMLPKS